jgi:tetratricopeptide (TPR) repeat protein
VISEASDALYRLLKENSKRMKPLRDSTAGRTAVEKQEETYRRILKAHPLHPFALYSYARFLSNVRKDDRQADQYFQLALKASPFNPEMLSTYAHFLERRLRDLDKAHRFYKRAYFVDRLNADVVGAYAIFQHRMLRNYKEAEKLFKQVPLSLALRQATAIKLATAIARVLTFVDLGFLRQALELDDENVNLVGYYALFLQKAKRNLSERCAVHHTMADCHGRGASLSLSL